MLHKPFEHRRKLAAGFARPHHADVERGETFRPAGERGGKAGALHNFIAEVGDDFILRTAGFTQRQRMERGAEGHAGCQKVGQLAREQQQFGQLHAGAALATALQPEPFAARFFDAAGGGCQRFSFGPARGAAFFLRHGKRLRRGIGDGYWNKALTAQQRQKRASVRRFQRSFAALAGAGFRDVVKLRHGWKRCAAGALRLRPPRRRE